MNALRVSGRLQVPLLLVLLACCDRDSRGADAGPEPTGWEAAEGAPGSEAPYVVLKNVQVGKCSVQFYLHWSPDSAVLGFSLEGAAGKRRYFPMYGSTSREMPAVTLEVFASPSQDAMWVQSSWSGYEVLAHHRFGQDECVSAEAERASFGEPTPASFPQQGQLPKMDPSRVSKVATIKHAGK